MEWRTVELVDKNAIDPRWSNGKFRFFCNNMWRRPVFHIRGVQTISRHHSELEQPKEYPKQRVYERCFVVGGGRGELRQ